MKNNFLEEQLQTADSEVSFYVKNGNFLSYQSLKRLREKYLSHLCSLVFILVEVTNSFLVSWNYSSHNSICSSKESFISQGSFATKSNSLMMNHRGRRTRWLFVRVHMESKFWGRQKCNFENVCYQPLAIMFKLKRWSSSFLKTKFRFDWWLQFFITIME